MAQEADIEKCPHKSIMLHLHLSSPHHKSGQNSVIRDKEVVVKVKDNRKQQLRLKQCATYGTYRVKTFEAINVWYTHKLLKDVPSVMRSYTCCDWYSGTSLKSAEQEQRYSLSKSKCTAPWGFRVSANKTLLLSFLCEWWMDNLNLL